MMTIARYGFLFAALSAAASGQYFTDMFTSAALNTSTWRVVPAFSDSSAIQSGGTLVLMNGGRVVTATEFPGAIDVTVKFQFTGNSRDNLRIVTRTDGATIRGEFARGIVFHVQMQTDPGDSRNNIYIHNATGPIATATYPISLNQHYTARVVDDGATLLFYVNDLNVPLLRATDSTVYGRQIGIRNREGSGAGSSISAGSQVRISAFAVNATSVVTLTNTVTNTVTVPDTSGRLVNLSTLGSGGFTMGFVVAGSTAKRVLIRAVGPTLQSFGVSDHASQTSLALYSGSNPIGSNSGWTNASNAAQMSAIVGPFPLIVGSADSAILATLSPGNYTAQASANGVVLLEVYDTP